jgi:hypothetical protein
MAEQRDKKTGASASPTPMKRAEDLLRNMTIEEKAMQLSCIYPIITSLRDIDSRDTHLNH